jgi:CheY-like chemotaxis protein
VTSREADCPSGLDRDIGLPGTDGGELATIFRARPETEDALIVAITRYGGASDIEKSKLAGFDEHLVKPVDPQALPEVLATTHGSSSA